MKVTIKKSSLMEAVKKVLKEAGSPYPMNYGRGQQKIQPRPKQNVQSIEDQEVKSQIDSIAQFIESATDDEIQKIQSLIRQRKGKLFQDFGLAGDKGRRQQNDQAQWDKVRKYKQGQHPVM